MTDAGLKHLAGLKNLASLDLQSSRVTAAGVDELQKALPRCKILASPARNPFLGRDSAALLKVLKIGVGVQDKSDSKVKQYPVTVEIVSQLPPGKAANTQREILILHSDRDPSSFPHMAAAKMTFSRNDNWFPLEIGKELVVAFEGNNLPEQGALLTHLGVGRCLARLHSISSSLRVRQGKVGRRTGQGDSRTNNSV